MDKSNFFRVAFGVLCFSFLVGVGFSQTLPGKRIRLYNHPMNPRQHPDDQRRAVKPPDAALFGSQVQFITLRWFDDDFIKTLDKHTVKYDLGNIIWPLYAFLYRDDLPEIVKEIKNRNLFLYDIWGYIPGSGPGTAGQKNELGNVFTDPLYWQQYIVPQSTLSFLEKELGNRWLGMDNGEQDGRYVSGFANQMIPVRAGREQQYLNFQNHFQGLCNRLGNKMATLVSLNYGHYFLKEGVYTLIGAETAQALPNTQVYYSFIRGAGKQYGVPWFGNASVWNRWGVKNYEGETSIDGKMGETEGTSLSLLKRLIYNHIMYNCVAVGFEHGYFNQKGKLSPIGEIQQSANRWIKKHGSPGTMYTPVAIMTDFFSGWTFPRHLYTNNIFRVWGNLPYGEGDYLTDGILNMLYPGYRDASYFHDESGFISPTPYGDIADCILSDAPLWLLKQYPVLVIGGKLAGGHEIKDKLEEYVRSGGRLVVTAGILENMPGGLLDVKIGQKDLTIENGSSVVCGNMSIREESDFKIKDISFPEGTKILAFCNQEPLAIEHADGLGTIIVFASSFGTSSAAQDLPESQIDKNFSTPFPLLGHVRHILGNIISATKIFNTNDELSLITCSKSKEEYTVAVCNNSWQEKPFAITSTSGKILSVTEMPLDCRERKAVGFAPKEVLGNSGKNSGKTIAGGDIRIFSIKLEANNVDETPLIKPVSNPENRGLTLRKVSSIKEEILLRPTFFQHFDRVVVDWKYLQQKEKSILAEESGWIKRQGLKLIVDFSSGINLFPDLRLVDNHPEYAQSMATIKSVIEKLVVLGAKDMIITTHRTVENNYSEQQFNESIRKSVKEICQNAAKFEINVHLRIRRAVHQIV